MKQLVLLLATMAAVAACGGGGPDQAGPTAPNEPQRTQAESAQPGAPEEPTRKRVPADNEATEDEPETAREGGQSPGFSVTTLEGEKVRLGGQGDVAALFFMAGW